MPASQQGTTIDTRIGKLELVNGYPSSDTAEKLYDEMDFQRATQAYLWAFPAVSCAAFPRGLADFFGAERNDITIWENFLDTKTFALTGNNSTIYAVSILDLAKDGPVVLDIPPGPTVGMIDDFWFRSISMIGRPGPDQGKGGRFLVLPPGYRREIPEPGYFIVESPMNDLNVLVRGLVQDGNVEGATAMLRKLRVYPYSQRANPKGNRFFNATGKAINLLEADGLDFWKALSAIINNNPVESRDRFFLAMLKPVGIEKGKPFEPDQRQRKILEDAAVRGRAMAAANTFEPRLAGALWYPGTHWTASVLLDPSQESKYYSEIDERLHWFFIATYMNPAMKLTEPGPGSGSVYIQTFKDSGSQWLDGTHNYRLHVPANPPAKDFWSITVCDNITRSMIQNTANKAALSSTDRLKVNADGSVDLYFGPNEPQGLAGNWVDTRPAKGFFVSFRSYTPTEAYFNKSWSLPDIEKVK